MSPIRDHPDQLRARTKLPTATGEVLVQGILPCLLKTWPQSLHLGKRWNCACRSPAPLTELPEFAGLSTGLAGEELLSVSAPGWLDFGALRLYKRCSSCQGCICSDPCCDPRGPHLWKRAQEAASEHRTLGVEPALRTQGSSSRTHRAWACCSARQLGEGPRLRRGSGQLQPEQTPSPPKASLSFPETLTTCSLCPSP